MKPDPATVTITLLAHISQQLAGTQGSVPALSPAELSFHAEPLDKATNFFWFTSLWFSVGTALIVTLVKQWLILYMQAIERPSSLRKQAHVRTYLYRGMRTFAMSYIITIAIPTLIHISLVFFFLGIVTFMYQISRFIAFTMLAFQVFGLMLYYMFSILPFVYSNCPYRSPLTYVYWWIWTWLCVILNMGSRGGKRERSFNQRIERDALGKSTELGGYAMRLTLGWLTDDHGFQKFIEEIPAFLHSGNAGDRAALVVLPHENSYIILDRVIQLLRTCHDQTVWQREKRATTCIAAIWSILVTFSFEGVPRINQPPRSPFADIQALMEFSNDSAKDVSHYARCAVAAVLCHALRKWEVSGPSQKQFPMLGSDIKPMLQLCKYASRYQSLKSLWEAKLHELETVNPLNWAHFMSQVFVLAAMDYCDALIESPFVPAEVVPLRFSVLPVAMGVNYLDPNIQGVAVRIVMEGMKARYESSEDDREVEWKVPPSVIEQILPLFKAINADQNVVNGVKEAVRRFLDFHPSPQVLDVGQSFGMAL